MPRENDFTDKHYFKQNKEQYLVSHIECAFYCQISFNITLWNTKPFSVVYNTSSGFSDASWSQGLYWLHDFEVKSAFLITQKRSVEPTTIKPQIKQTADKTDIRMFKYAC